jgi:hypothetical protein
VIQAILSATESPEFVREAIRVCCEARNVRPKNAPGKELTEVKEQLEALETEEKGIVLAQIEGVRAGASTHIYLQMLSKIALRRKELMDRLRLARTDHGEIKPSLSASKVDLKQVLSDIKLALTSEHVTGAEKRDLLGSIVDRVVCRKDGADVHFLPGLFDQLGRETVQMTFTTSSNIVGLRSR